MKRARLRKRYIIVLVLLGLLAVVCAVAYGIAKNSETHSDGTRADNSIQTVEFHSVEDLEKALHSVREIDSSLLSPSILDDVEIKL